MAIPPDCIGGLQNLAHQKAHCSLFALEGNMTRPNKLIIDNTNAVPSLNIFWRDSYINTIPKYSSTPQLIMVARAALNSLGHCWILTGVID